MPDPTNQLLALSSGFDRLSMEMSAVNLMGCHHISSVYVCEQHGVLKRELNSTCLGSLYVQDFQGATSLFEMEIVPQVETVLQLQDNWYLVYSPRSLCKIALTPPAPKSSSVMEPTGSSSRPPVGFSSESMHSSRTSPSAWTL